MENSELVTEDQSLSLDVRCEVKELGNNMSKYFLKSVA